jgi:hypothetical protein
MWRIKADVKFNPFGQTMVHNTPHQNSISTVKKLALNINSLPLTLLNRMESVKEEIDILWRW